MLVRFRQTAAGLQCSLVETHRIDGAVRYEHVASLGSVPASPSVEAASRSGGGLMNNWPSLRTGSMPKRKGG
jgi:hypothetical protein